MSKSILLTALSLLFIISCNPASNDEPSDPAITPGIYDLEAQSTSVNDKVVSAGRIGGGGYYAERIQLYADSLWIEITSDIPGENGTAKAHYQIRNSTLHLNIVASTTSLYTVGSETVFTDFKIVDKSFSHAFGSDSNSYTFTGPGLLLESQYTDQQDLDDDGDTVETVTRTEFYNEFKMYTIYDNGGL